MIVILGGGLAGLSTAWSLGTRPHVVLEAEDEPGGLCRSRRVGEFDFDYTGHLLHLRDPRATALVEELWPGVFEVIARKAAIRTRGVTVPFPFQAHLHGLPEDVIVDCVVGAAEALGRAVPDDPAISFHDWSIAALGRGISDAFMFPYNGKLFRRDPREMTADWVSWAVPRPNLGEIVRGALGIRNDAMGYNATFRYPRRGGIDIVPRAIASRVKTLRTGARAVAVDLDAKRVTLASGESITYERLVVTIPLPAFLGMARSKSLDGAALSRRLDWSVVGCLNLGIDREGIGGGAHWIYFPDPEVPFYRVGFPSAFSRGVAPEGTSSLYVEFGLTRAEDADPAVLERQALAVLRREGLLDGSDRVVARDFIRIDPGYVIFDRARQEVMARATPQLAAAGVRLIGRYGAWTYSYMERAILDGIEAAEALSRGA
ncbi:MAG TPA: FAD-dependent oxidoreductase [Candidatus Sulfotelmatobacter sp.]|jgi:protoporphyrinogen oxidase|nr:FAD-dependent oxidoreductase [Candidatus Sulfotelmatobacter sp.]